MRPNAKQLQITKSSDDTLTKFANELAQPKSRIVGAALKFLDKLPKTKRRDLILPLIEMPAARTKSA